MEVTTIEMTLMFAMMGSVAYIHTKFAFKSDMDKRFDKVDKEFKEVKRLIIESMK